jgi:hypothetical protein
MKVGDITKLITLMLVIISISILMGFRIVPAEVGTPILAASLGYVFGNTHGVIESKSNNE